VPVRPLWPSRQAKPFTGIGIFENQQHISALPDVDDPQGSAVDADMLARYILVAAERYPIGILSKRMLNTSVANKLIYSNVALFDPGTHKHLAHGRHHSGRPGNVIDWSLQTGQISAQHLFVYQGPLALPIFLGFRHFCHGADQAEIRICPLQSP
jgi:hypothetical protein